MTIFSPQSGRIHWLSTVLVIACTGIVGCSGPSTGVDGDGGDAAAVGDGGDGGEGGEGGLIASQCTPDPAVLARPRRCLTDEHCACGAHCEYGRCVASCGAGMAMCPAGERCDRFGRCRAAADQDLVPAVAAAAGAVMDIDNSQVILGAGGTKAPIRFRLRQRPQRRIRVVASSGFQVDCGQATFATECSFMAPAMDTTLTTNVRPDPGMPMQTTTGQVQLYGDSNYESVTVVPSTMAPAPMRAMDGVYTGIAALQGIQSDEMASAQTPPVRVEIPLTVKVFGGGANRTVQIIDTLRVLTSSDNWVGTVNDLASGMVRDLTLAPRRLVSYSPFANGRLDVSVRPITGSNFAVNQAGGSLTINLALAMDGTHPRRRPVFRWRALLIRSGDLPPNESIPTVSAAENASNAMALATTALDAETGVNSALRPTLPLTITDYEAFMRTTGEVAMSDRRLDVCRPNVTITPSTFNALALREWTNPTAMPNGVKSGLMLTNRNAVLNVLVRPYLANDIVQNISVSDWNPPSLAIANADYIACAVQFGAQNTNACALGGGRVEDYGGLDRCQEFADSIGCAVEDVANGATVRLDGSVTVRRSGDVSACTSALQINGRVTRVCRFRRPTDAQCAEWTTCQSPSVMSANNGLGAARLNSTLLPNSVIGDLSCGTQSVATVADQRRESSMVALNTLLQQCIADLDRLRTAVPANPTAGGAGLTQIYRAGAAADAACIDAVRHVVALSYAMSSDRNIAVTGMGTADPRGSRFAHRLWQQWLSLHSMISNEAQQQLLVDPAVRGMNPPTNLFATDEASLGRTLGAFSLLLHPRLGAGLWEMASDVLDRPDYRVRTVMALPMNGNHQQPVGLAVVLGETIQRQLALLQTLVERAANRGDRSIVVGSAMNTDPLVGRTYRSVLSVLPLWLSLQSRAQEGARMRMGSLSWLDKLNRTNSLVSSALLDVSGAVEILRSGSNPLGIEDSDLPLYFRGNPTDADGRFSAVSNYLIGSNPGSSGWATAAITEARTAVNAVSAAYQAQAQRQYQSTLSGNELQNQLDRIRRTYGGQIASLCGTPDAIVDTVDVLERWETVTGQPFRGATCFRKVANDCGNDNNMANTMVSLDDIKFALCRVRRVNSSTSNALTSPNPLLNSLITGGDPSESTCSSIVACAPPTAADERCLQCGASVLRVPLSALRILSNFSYINGDVVRNATSECRAIYPSAAEELPAQSDLTVDPAALPRCYLVRGSLGELSMGINQATTDLDIARSEYSARQESYDIAMRGCFIQLDGDNQVNAATAMHEATMTEMRQNKFEQDRSASIAGAAKDCIDAIGGASILSPQSIVTSIGSCVATSVRSGFEVSSLEIARDMEDAEAQHGLLVSQYMANTNFRVCANAAAMELVGARSASLQVQRAVQDLSVALYQLESGMGDAESAWAEGHAALATARERAVRPPEFDVWVDSSVVRYRESFRRAKRFTYLALRAVEYEYQVTMSGRSQVLSATRVEELETAMSGLRAVTMAARINGNPPSNTRAVVSLRENLLQLHSTTVLSASEQRLNEVERFRLLLQNPRFAVYRGMNEYAGQRIPFSLAPLRSLRVGNAGDVPIFASNSCAERLWSVNAMVEGDPATVYRGNVATFTAIDLEKTNSFYSQWCTDMVSMTGARLFQTASVRPSINLFRDPSVGALDLGGGNVIGGSQNVGNGLQNVSIARIQPRLNVSRTQFAMDEFGSGSSSELAGRGLFGPYAIIIPAEAISRRGADGTYTNGLNLDQVTDILLRIDYVSVARSGM